MGANSFVRALVHLGALRAHLFTVSVSGILFRCAVKGAEIYVRGGKDDDVTNTLGTPLVRPKYPSEVRLGQGCASGALQTYGGRTLGTKPPYLYFRGVKGANI